MKPAILHAHSEFSTRDSLIRIDELPAAAAKEGWTACALTDHGGIEGVPKFMKACAKVGIKPIIGCEIYVSCPDTHHHGKYHKEDKLNHLTILTKNAKGFSSLMSLLSIGHRQFYDTKRQKAAIPLSLVLDKIDNCVILSGCFSSPFWRGTEAAAEDLINFSDKFKDDLYFEVQPLHDWDEQIKLNKTILDLSMQLGISTVMTPDCHFCRKEEKVFHDALLAVADRTNIHDPKRWKFSTDRSYIGTPQDAIADLTNAGFGPMVAQASVEITEAISEKISAWTWDDLPKPTLPHMEGNMSEIAWKALEDKGLKGKSEYDERLKTELATFAQGGLDQYILLVRHCMQVLRKEGAEIGPRGSVGGSLLAYCLDITPLDPIVHGLSWERFYAPGRKGWPDVDLDLDEQSRLRVPEILRREFGDDKVAQISNYTTFGLRMAINDAARAYGIELMDDSKFEDDKNILKGKREEDIDVTDIPPGKELAKKSADAVTFARMMVGRIRQFGAHAGGFVIAAEPLTSGRAAIVSRGKDKALPWDMEVAEELGFVKLDFLGLDTLSAIKTIEAQVKMDWNAIDLNDPEVMKDLSEGRTAGVPQFLSQGFRSFLRNLKPTCFLDLVWANAAFRPGGLGQYTPEQMVAQYRDDPNEIIVYQEDVMNICVRLAGFSWTDADKVRKVMAKSKGIEEMEKWRTAFVQGCIKNSSAEKEAADAFWQKLLNFGRYAFNKSHATSYAWNAYRIAWAKRYHPLPTFRALLQSRAENFQPIIEEAPKFGIKILSPDANKSDLDWTFEDKAIRMPLQMGDGMDMRLANIVKRLRGEGGLFKGPEDLKNRLIRTIAAKPLTKTGRPSKAKAKIVEYKYPPIILESLFDGRMPGYTFGFPTWNPQEKFQKKEQEALRDREKDCTACALRVTCKKVVPLEFGRTNVMIVGESPGKTETWKAAPFVGPSGELVDRLLFNRKVSGKDFTWTNVSHCQPPYVGEGETGPMPKSKIEELMLACPWVDEEIDTLKPPLILALGKKAWTRLGGSNSITKANGTVMDRKGVKVVACIHPASVLRDHGKERMPDFEAAIDKFVDLYRTLLPYDGKEIERRVLPPQVQNFDRARQFFQR